jgi:uncharacterized protein (AIM24 family)
MAGFWGSDGAKSGSFVGEPPQRGNGFGRRSAFPDQPVPVENTLSSAAQRVIEEYRAQKTVANDIDFVIGGGDIQYVEIELDPGEAVVAENGSMIWKANDIDLSLVMGDGKDDDTNFARKIVSAGSNLFAGESFYLTEFRNTGFDGKARVALGGKLPGQIVPVRLDAMGGKLICSRGCFLAAAKGVGISAALQRDAAASFWNKEGMIMQTLTGSGWAFLHIGGNLIERELAAGESIQVDTGCVAAHEPSVEMGARFVGGIGKAIAGGEGVALTSLKGPGKVWIQSLPFARVANATVDAGTPAVSSDVKQAVAEYGISEGLDALRKFL